MKKMLALSAVWLMSCSDIPGTNCFKPTEEFMRVAPNGWETSFNRATKAWSDIGAPEISLSNACYWRLKIKEQPGKVLASASGRWIKGPEPLMVSGKLKFDADRLKNLQASQESCEEHGGGISMENVFIHELGHVFRLRYPNAEDPPHSLERSSPLWYWVGSGCEPVLPTSKDIERVREVFRY